MEIKEGVGHAGPLDGKVAGQMTAPVLFAPMPGALFVHLQPDFHDFAVQPLLSGYLSVTGPCMAKADINGDGLEDIFIGGGRGQASLIAVQQPDGSL